MKALDVKSFRLGVIKFQSFFFFTLLLNGCINPVTPEFDFDGGLIFVDALASNIPGSSYATIEKSDTQFGFYKKVFQEGAMVKFQNTLTDEVVELEEQEGIYKAPPNFAVSVGETWQLIITLADGSELKSEPETVIEPVDISGFSANYEPELKFDESKGKYIPGHNIAVSFNEPGELNNYYYWRFKSFEKLEVCKYCPYGKFRNGECVNDVAGFSYPCEVPCWRIRYNEEVSLFNDEFTNGKSIQDLSVAILPLFTKENILVTVQQISLSPNAYKYYKTLKDIVDNNAGINAPPPAALVGNMYNVLDEEVFILGRFTVTASTNFSIYIDRSSIEERPLENEPPFRIESGLGQVVVTFPCVEGRYRTSQVPLGWPK